MKKKTHNILLKKIGSTDFVETTLDTLKKECVTTATRDESFQKSDNSSSNSTDGGGLSILDMLSTMVCPNNCSQKGACINGMAGCYCNFALIVNFNHGSTRTIFFRVPKSRKT